MIEFKNVVKRYSPTQVALDGIDLRIEDGEFVFIMGESGAGKTTMTRLLLREEKATSGDLIVGGTNLSKMPAAHIPRYRRHLGVVFQDFRLFPKKTAFENVAFALQVVGNASKAEVKSRVLSMLRIVGLEEKASRFPDELSGGEKQRVALARALINNPHTIIADEPTGNLDPKLSMEIMSLLIKMKEYGKTVVVVTHEAELAKSFQQRIVRIHEGRIVEDIPAGGELQ
ncbi:MAG: ATP-binding cassette domain-containing protein [Clostridia bacterium]|nr:ATP-binding cassette domain-containing protein [Clostridia bacterium]